MGISYVEKLKQLTSVYRKAVVDEDNKDKNGYYNFSRTFSLLCQIQWEKGRIYIKSYFVSSLDYANTASSYEWPSTVGYFKGLLNLGQEKKEEDKFLINLLCYYTDKRR